MASASKRPLINLLKGWPSKSLLPATTLQDAANASLSDPSVAESALLYGLDEGYPPLREALASWLTWFYKPKHTISAQHLSTTGGASQNLACILQVYTDPIYTRNIWMVSPTYFMACTIFEDSGFHGRLRSVPEDQGGINLHYLREHMSRSENAAQKKGNIKPELKPPRAGTKIYRHIIYAVPTFSNPSSKTMPRGHREELVRVAREFDALVITDDVYDQLQWYSDKQDGTAISTAVEPRICDIDKYLDGGAERAGADGFGNSCSNGSFSKIVAPGCRTGWAEGTIKFAYGLSQCGSTKSGGAPSQLVAAFLADYIKTGTLQSHITKTLQPAYARRYRLMMDAIQEILVPLGVKLPQPDRSIVGGYFLWMELPAPLLASEVAARAKETQNLIIGPGPIFAVHGNERKEELARAVRLSFSWESEDVLQTGIGRLGAVVKEMLGEVLDGAGQ